MRARGAAPVASNAAQIAAWDGDTGAFWADNADRLDRGVAAYRGLLLDAAALEQTATVLDIGCGSGQSTRDAARRASRGSALGIDLSSRLIDLARARAANENLPNVAFQQADAQIHPFPAERFDLAISQHGAMFFDNPVTAFTNIGSALRPGGRLILLVWQPLDRNEFIHAVLRALSVDREPPEPPSDAPSPVALADPDRVHTLLTAAGFTGIDIEAVQRPMNLGTDLHDAFTYLCGQHAELVRGLDPSARTTAYQRLEASLADHHVPGRGVLYGSASWLVRARRAASTRTTGSGTPAMGVRAGGYRDGLTLGLPVRSGRVRVRRTARASGRPAPTRCPPVSDGRAG